MTVIQFPTAAAAADAAAVEAEVESVLSDQARYLDAVGRGLLPKDSRIAVSLALKLIKDTEPDQPVIEDFRDLTKIKSGDYKRGRLNARPKQIQRNRTALTYYGDVVATVKVFEDAETAQKFADYENGKVERFFPKTNDDPKIELDVVHVKHDWEPSSHWKVVII